MSDRQVGFIGLGNMGFGMARNLIENGYSVRAYDIASQPLERLVQQGAERAADPADIGATCDRVMIMVVNAEQVEAVLDGPKGLLSTMKAGTILVHSTVALEAMRTLHAKAKSCGIEAIDCPVSGGVERANNGTLTILCGGDQAAFEDCRGLLDAVADNVTHLGPLGAGLVGKLANNLVIGVGRLAIGEAFAMAKRAGLDTEQLFRTMITCSADSWQLRQLEGALLRNEFPPATFHGVKDLSAALDSARTVGQPMPVTSLVRELYQLIDQKMGGLNGSNQVVRYYLDD